MNDAHRERQNRLLEKSEGLPFLIFDLDRTMPPNMDQVSLRYLTGYTGEGALLITPDEPVLFTDSRYLEQAEREVPQIRLVHAEDDYMDDMASEFARLGVKRLGYASWRATDFVVRALGQRTGVETVAFKDPVSELRACKDAVELAALRRAAEISEAALLDLLPTVKAGDNEVEIAERFVALMKEHGGQPRGAEPVVASGPNSALPHYRPSLGRRTVQEGDLLLFDFCVLIDGYHSDISRTVVVGRASDKQREVYRLVNEALNVGLSCLRAGAKGCDIHRAASRVIEDSPYAKDIFLSPLGHGVGLEVHEAPRMGLQMDEVVQAGMVVTVEPGIYIPGYGGVRIEEMAVITETGYELLSSSPRAELAELV